MKRYFFALGLILGLVGSASAQSCYSGSYGAPQAEPFALSAQTQSYTVQVPVTVTVQAQPVAVAAPAPVALAAPAPCAQSYGYAQSFAAPFVQSYGVAACAPQVGFNAGFSYGGNVGFAGGFNHNVGFVNRGFVNQGFNRFGAGGFVGGGSNIVARDRRGTAVNANFGTNVKIKRGLFGNIREVNTDSNRGLLGRISPF